MAFLFIMENEIWKDIPNYEGLYQVSNLGRVKSLRFKKEKILKNIIDNYGYYQIILHFNSNIKSFKIHQLVAICFLNHIPCGFKLVVNHKDFNRQNNYLDNLEIVTQRENANRKHIKSSSKYIGVSWHKNKNKWISRIRIKGLLINIGTFLNEYDAHLAYENKLKELL